MMHIVYTVLRVGIVLVFSSEITMFIDHYHVNNFIYWTDNPELLIRLTIFSVWIETESSYLTLLRGYALWLVVFGICLTLFRLFLTRK